MKSLTELFDGKGTYLVGIVGIILGVFASLNIVIPLAAIQIGENVLPWIALIVGRRAIKKIEK